MLPITVIMAGLSAASKLTLSGETITDVQVTPTNAIAAVVVNTDGTVDREITSGTTQIDSATDWIIPNSAANSAYQVRAQNIVWDNSGDGESFTQTGIPVDGTWADLSTGRKLEIQQTNDTAAVKQVTFDLQIRFGGSGDPTVSTSYILHAEVAV